MNLLLFDIDGTLIDAGGAGARALNQALEDVSGIPEGFRGIDLAGKTDLQIIREGLRKMGLQPGDGIESALVGRYTTHLRGEMARCRGHLKPGVKELLPRLRERVGIHLGLLTGNVDEGARLKLGPFGLNDFFPIGAFGDDDEDRNRLLPVVVRRLLEKDGISVLHRECVVIGDTPRDVECARENGSRTALPRTARR